MWAPWRRPGGRHRGQLRLGDRRRAGGGGGVRPRGHPAPRADARVSALQEQIAGADPTQRAKLRTRLDELIEKVRSEKLGEVAAEFDQVHSIKRAREVGSVHAIIAAEELRPWLIEAIERGMEQEEARWKEAGGGESFEEARIATGARGKR